MHHLQKFEKNFGNSPKTTQVQYTSTRTVTTNTGSESITNTFAGEGAETNEFRVSYGAEANGSQTANLQIGKAQEYKHEKESDYNLNLAHVYEHGQEQFQVGPVHGRQLTGRAQRQLQLLQEDALLHRQLELLQQQVQQLEQELNEAHLRNAHLTNQLRIKEAQVVQYELGDVSQCECQRQRQGPQDGYGEQYQNIRQARKQEEDRAGQHAPAHHADHVADQVVEVRKYQNNVAVGLDQALNELTGLELNAHIQTNGNSALAIKAYVTLLQMNMENENKNLAEQNRNQKLVKVWMDQCKLNNMYVHFTDENAANPVEVVYTENGEYRITGLNLAKMLDVGRDQDTEEPKAERHRIEIRGNVGGQLHNTDVESEHGVQDELFAEDENFELD